MTSRFDQDTSLVVLYDGDCGMCTWAVTNLRQRLPAPVVPQPYQEADLSAFGLTEEQAGTAMYLLDTRSGTQFRGHKAFGRWFQLVGPPWTVVGWLLRYPPLGWVAWLVYRLVARHRRLIPGPWRSAGSCAIR